MRGSGNKTDFLILREILETLSLPDVRDLMFSLSAASIYLGMGTDNATLKQGQLMLPLVSLSMTANAHEKV